MNHKKLQGKKVTEFDISKLVRALTTATEKADTSFFDKQKADVKRENRCCAKTQNEVSRMKKFMSNQWICGIATGLLSSLLLSWIISDSCRSMFKKIISFAVNIGHSLLTFELRVWWVLIAVVLIAAILLAVSKCSAERAARETPEFLQYTKDSLREYAWEWRYGKNSNGKYAICDLHPVCKKCGMRLKQEAGTYGWEMRCLRCNSTQRWKDSFLIDAQMLIEDNIKRTYQQHP